MAEQDDLSDLGRPSTGTREKVSVKVTYPAPSEHDPDDLSDLGRPLSLGKAEGIRGPLSPMEVVGAIAKQTARQAPVALGTIGGGMIGGAMGAPAGPAGAFAGATTGAGLGASGGELLLQGLQKVWPSVFGEPPKSLEEAASRIAKESSGGMIAEAGGRGLQTALPAMMERTIKPSTSRELGILEREKIPYTAGDVRPGGMAQITENLMRGTMLGGKVMQEADIAAATKLSDYRTRVLNQIGPLLSKEESGRVLKASVEKRGTELFGPDGLFDKAYSRLKALYPARIDTAFIRKEVAPIKAELDALIQEGRMPSANSPEAPSRFYDLVEDLSQYGLQNPKVLPGPGSVPSVRPTIGGEAENLATMRTQATAPPLSQYPTSASVPAAASGPMRPMPSEAAQMAGPYAPQKQEIPVTYKDVWQDKQTIDSIIRNLGDDNLRTRAKAVVKRLHNILDQAMENAAGSVGTRAARDIRNVNAAYRNAKQLFETESLVADIGKMDPEKVVGRFFPPGSVTPAKDLLRALPSGQKQQLRPMILRRTMENILAPLAKETEDVTVHSGVVFAKKFEAARDTLKTLTTPEQMTALEELIDAMKRSQSSGSMQNPSSGRQLLAWGQAGLIVNGIRGAATGDPASVGGGVVGIIGPYALARLLTNPTAAKTIAKGFTMSPTSAGAALWTTRMMNLIRLAHEKGTDANEPPTRP